MTTDDTEPAGTTADDGFGIETWAYAGLRLNNKGKLIHAWIDSTSETELHYDLKGRYAIGYLYDARVRRDNDEATLRGTPAYTSRRHDDIEQCRAWHVKDTEARQRHAARRSEANAAKEDALAEAIEPLLAIARTLRTNADREALLLTVIRRLGGLW